MTRCQRTHAVIRSSLGNLLWGLIDMKFLVRVLSPLLIVVKWVTVVASQSGLTFDVVSIKENRGGTAGGASITPRSFAFLSITPAGLIRWAYDLSEREIVGGPAWIDTVRFAARNHDEGHASA